MEEEILNKNEGQDALTFGPDVTYDQLLLALVDAMIDRGVIEDSEDVEELAQAAVEHVPDYLLAEYPAVMLLQRLFEDGAIRVIDGLSPEEVAVALANAIVTEEGVRLDVSYQLGHEEKLLAEARRYRDGGDRELAITMYATWIEHRLNGVIAQKAEDSLSRREVQELLRSSSIHQKTGILWKMVVGSDFPAGLRTMVMRVAEERNSFVHYKWPAFQLAELRTQLMARASRLSACLDVAEQAVEELEAMKAGLTE